MLLNCKQATLNVGLVAGIGYSIPKPVTDAINFFLRKLNLGEIKGYGGLDSAPDHDHQFDGDDAADEGVRRVTGPVNSQRPTSNAQPPTPELALRLRIRRLGVGGWELGVARRFSDRWIVRATRNRPATRPGATATCGST